VTLTTGRSPKRSGCRKSTVLLLDQVVVTHADVLLPQVLERLVQVVVDARKVGDPGRIDVTKADQVAGQEVLVAAVAGDGGRQQVAAHGEQPLQSPAI
jgi:hypothetical protein